jgi:nucleoside-diphosphate-sugar epimerase
MIMVDNLLKDWGAEGKPIRVGMAGVRLTLGVLLDRPFERGRAADTHTAKVRLGWQAKIRLDEGLRLISPSGGPATEVPEVFR